MIYTKLTKMAMRYMFLKQKDQSDLSGVPYVFHPWHVAEEMKDELSTAAALLHDVLEDTGATPEELKEYGFPEDVVKTVMLLTRREGESYRVYIERLAVDPVARQIKLADLRHNMDYTRLDRVTERDRERLEVYIPAKKYLEEREESAVEGL